MIYDLAILGGGPAGVAAGVYASRKRLSTVFITPNFESQSSVAEDIQNWIGTVSISGMDLAKSLKLHLEANAGDIVAIREGEYVTNITKKAENFLIETKSDLDKVESYEVKTVLITTGSVRRKLEIPGAAEFENRGLTYCASCDGPLFSGSPVAVIGGGNAGFETAAQLLAYTESVTLIHRGPQFTADPVSIKKILEHPKMRGILNADITKIMGDKFVTGIAYKDKKMGTEETLTVAGVFVEIGMMPSTGFLNGLVDVDGFNRIIVDEKTQHTSLSGIWAAGDCTDGLYHQNNIAAGDAVRAVEDIYLTLMTHG